MAGSLPLLELTRGRLVESVHWGSIAVVDSSGKLIASHGDPHMVAFLRSSAKPFQVLPFVEHGGVEHYGYTERELSLSCASHDGARIHLDAVREMQKKIGIEEKDLQCGGHLPSDPEMLREFIRNDIKPASNHNNCSGKHTTMLAYARMRGVSLSDYLDIENPIQRRCAACAASHVKRWRSGSTVVRRRTLPCRCTTRPLAWHVCVIHGTSHRRGLKHVKRSQPP
jgi:L-asparaginase II